MAECEILSISLMCDKENLMKRLKKDIISGKRSEDIIYRSISRLDCYNSLKTLKIDTSNINEYQAAQIIAAL